MYYNFLFNSSRTISARRKERACHSSAQRSMERNFWLQEPNTQNTKRFHRDEKSWLIHPLVFIDTGRIIDHALPLLQRRDYLPLKDAVNEWHRLRRQGWIIVKPQWGSQAKVS